MHRPHRSNRGQRILNLEALEDRLTPSGIVTAIQDPHTGAVLIRGDNLDNAFQVNRGTSDSGDVLEVSAVPGSDTAVNGITLGVGASFPLSSITGLFISEGDGQNTILLGNITGFELAGNIQIDTGAGTDNVELTNITLPAGGIGFDGLYGGGTGTDRIAYTNVRAGSSFITPGSGPLTLVQTSVVFDFDGVFAARTQSDGDSIRIVSSAEHPPDRLHAIGQLSIAEGNGDNRFSLDTLDVGPTIILAGTGNNTLTFSH